jgi:hypothetical protein
VSFASFQRVAIGEASLFPGSSIVQTTLVPSLYICASKEVTPLCGNPCQQLLSGKTLESVKTHNAVLHVGRHLLPGHYLLFPYAIVENLSEVFDGNNLVTCSGMSWSRWCSVGMSRHGARQAIGRGFLAQPRTCQ